MATSDIPLLTQAPSVASVTTHRRYMGIELSPVYVEVLVDNFLLLLPTDGIVCLAISGMYICVHVRRSVKKFPVVFDMNCLLHEQFVPTGHSVTGHFRVPIMQMLRGAVRRKRTDQQQAGKSSR
jgi:hypothetical protein